MKQTNIHMNKYELIFMCALYIVFGYISLQVYLSFVMFFCNCKTKSSHFQVLNIFTNTKDLAFKTSPHIQKRRYINIPYLFNSYHIYLLSLSEFKLISQHLISRNLLNLLKDC